MTGVVVVVPSGFGEQLLIVAGGIYDDRSGYCGSIRLW
jgi:hypothetical protein